MLSGVSNDKMYEDVELDTISIGNLSLVTAPFELFDTTGKNIKNSSSSMIFIMGYTNGYHGYLPSSLAYDYGCYEVDNSYFKKGSAESVQDKLLSMINENKDKKEQTDGFINGDINGDGKVSVLDYIMIRRHILKLDLLTNSDITRADMNRDGSISALDYIAIRKIILSGN